MQVLVQETFATNMAVSNDDADYFTADQSSLNLTVCVTCMKVTCLQ